MVKIEKVIFCVFVAMLFVMPMLSQSDSSSLVGGGEVKNDDRCIGFNVLGDGWNKTFGGSDADQSHSVIQTADGGYVLAGTTASFGAGGDDMWLVKTDGEGNEQWNRTFGVRENDVGWDCQQTSDGGYVMAGFAGSSSSIYGNVLLIKTDGNGDEMWTKTFEDDDGSSAYSVQQTADGGYIIGGVTNLGEGHGDILLVKTDGDGNFLWDRIFGGYYPDACYSVRQTADGCYIIAGETYSFGAGIVDAWLVKTAEPAVKIWISGGFGLHVLIKNIADDELHDIGYSIEFSGLIFIGRESTGFISSIPPGGEVAVNMPVFGIGSVTVKVTASDISKTAHFRVFGPFLLPDAK